MKKTILTEQTHYRQPFFDDKEFAAHPLMNRHTSALQNNPTLENTSLDKCFSAVKWIFLYLPGTATIHLIMMGFALSFFYHDWSVELLLAMTGIFTVSTFMIMLGIGKLTDLKYLKVVGAISLTSVLMAILYAALAVLIPGDFFGIFTKLTLPLPVLVGYLIKVSIDNETEGK